MSINIFRPRTWEFFSLEEKKRFVAAFKSHRRNLRKILETDQQRDQWIKKYGLSSRARSAIQAKQIWTEKDFADTDLSQFVGMRNVGQKTIKELNVAHLIAKIKTEGVLR